MVAMDAQGGAQINLRAPASEEAKHRRRMSRKLARLAKINATEAEKERVILGRMVEVAERLCRRHWRHTAEPHRIVRLYEYWALRMMGYDALSPAMRQTGLRYEDGTPILHDPELSPVWVWWTEVHWRKRLEISGTYRSIAKGHCRAQQRASEREAMALTNPLFEVVAKRQHGFTD